MSVDAAQTVAWIAPGPPGSEESRALASWARARGVRLASPEKTPPKGLPTDPRAADDVEALLDRARDALAARDADTVDRVLAAAESTLRAHPELPQAAWLMAEVERARSARDRRLAPVDTDAADRAWSRAEALDGGRVAGIGEQATGTPPAPATLSLDVSPLSAERWLDGSPVRGGSVATRAGPHALVVTWRGTPIWARWIETPAGSSSVRVAAQAAPPCSADDVGLASVAGDLVEASGVQCPAWIAVTPAPQGIRVAVCEGDRCGPLEPWHPPVSWTWAPATPERSGGWPTWATWGLVGAGAVVATTVVLVAAGAFRSTTTDTTFASGGVKQQ